jgi:hypothetical protein
LNRSNSLSDSQNSGLSAALDRADSLLDRGGSDEDLASDLSSLAAGLGDSGDAQTRKRKTALADTLNGIADKLAAGR